MGIGDDVTPTNMLLEPPLEWNVVESLMKKFDGIIRGFCDVDILVDAQVTILTTILASKIVCLYFINYFD